MNFELIKKTFTKKLSYLDFFTTFKHSVVNKLGIFNPWLTKQIQQHTQELLVAVKKADTPREFFNAVISAIAAVYVLKQEHHARKNDFEDCIKGALKACLGSGDIYFDAAIKGIIRRVDMLPNNFYKDKGFVINGLDDAIRVFLNTGQLPDTYLDAILRKDNTPRKTVFYKIESSHQVNAGAIEPSKDLFVVHHNTYTEEFSNLTQLYYRMNVVDSVENQHSHVL